MPEHNSIVDDLDFENKINKLGDNQLELIKFIARQVHSTNIIVGDHTTRLNRLESTGRRALQIGGAIGGGIGSAIVAGIYFLTERLRR